MDLNTVINTNVIGSAVLITPEKIKELFPVSARALQTVINGRKTIQDIITRTDKRYFAIIGPCSIHDPIAALDYAKRLKGLAERVKDRIYIAMRVYFEKPRTTVGWKGLINDPFLDNSFQVEAGLKLARKLLLQFAELGLPTASEALDPVTPQYLSELIAWAAIGARTVESQTHREMASGLSMPVGFKNGTDGTVQTAIDAMKAVSKSHHFLGIDQKGQICRFETRGNGYAHLVLRGGGDKPNYTSDCIATYETMLERTGLRKAILIDCSHGNSNKDYTLQPAVFENCIDQILAGNRSIIGFMIESNIHAGNQSIPENLDELKYGVSITDTCIDWETTETIVLAAHRRLAPLFASA